MESGDSRVRMRSWSTAAILICKQLGGMHGVAAASYLHSRDFMFWLFLSFNLM